MEQRGFLLIYCTEETGGVGLFSLFIPILFSTLMEKEGSYLSTLYLFYLLIFEKFHCLFLLALCDGVCVGSLFCNVVLSILSGFAIILLGKRELVACFNCVCAAVCLLMFYGSSSQCRGWSVVCDCGIPGIQFIKLDCMLGGQPNHIGNFAFLFNCTPVGRTSNSMTVPT